MTDYERIAAVIRYLDVHYIEQPGLDALAELVGLSPFHFHRLFVRWAGVTPREFLSCLTIADARVRLREGESVLTAALQTGLSGPGRLHDLAVRLEAASPGEIKAGGRGWTIVAGVGSTPFGPVRVGIAPRGFCHVAFLRGEDASDRETGTSAILDEWPQARVEWDDLEIQRRVGGFFARPNSHEPNLKLKAIVRGTHFQVQVWRALLRIPPGCFASYGVVALALGRPAAARAVGTAVGKNPLAWLVPCHRVIRDTGVLGGYRWGRERKAAMAAWEGAWRENDGERHEVADLEIATRRPIGS